MTSEEILKEMKSLFDEVLAEYLHVALNMSKATVWNDVFSNLYSQLSEDLEGMKALELFCSSYM